MYLDIQRTIGEKIVAILQNGRPAAGYTETILLTTNQLSITLFGVPVIRVRYGPKKTVHRYNTPPIRKSAR